ncbi:xenotropic and polytropic retrovirus receptor 1 homolog [Drosophila obscura]|uniref:xenotropic and polytropic retrovirus receptor 1 homolog n=1 Tax=Drosophila obscura TaxID=7282 RepID=UPI001BB27FF2|nr:xenotropic and polytropic retrovirus receptor 1 homolog [Drosophila obscura]
MKFGQTLERHLVNEWREQYVNYELLKEMIKMGVDEAPDFHDYPLVLLHEYYERVNYEFFAACATEIVKVQLFFEEKLAASHRKQESFRATLADVREAGGAGGAGRQFHMRYPTLLPTQPQSIPQLRNAYSEFYLSLILLQNYQTLNQTAFRKICKKYDKNFRSSEGQLWYKTVVERSPFTDQNDLRNLMNEVEELYTQYLTQGDRSKAMTKLRVPPLGQPPNPCRVFFAGLFLGLFFVAAIMAGISYFFLDVDATFRVLFAHLYRGPFIFICYYFLVAMNLFIWQHVGINYVLIFELNPRKHLTPTAVLQIASTLASGWMLCALAFLHHEIIEVAKPYYFPLIWLGMVLLLVLNPFPILEYSARKWLLACLIRILAAPFLYVTFADFWLCEQMTSLTLCLVDHYMLCRFCVRYYANLGNHFDFEPDFGVALLRMLPAWLRVCQCLRRYREGTSKSFWYGLNALKYSLTIVMVAFSTIQMQTNAKYQSFFDNPWTYGYIISAFCCTIYQSYWDLRNDFGLFDSEHKPLREKLVYRKVY